MINLHVKFETQKKLAQIKLFDALTHGYRMRKKRIYSFKKYLPVTALCEEWSSLALLVIATVSDVNVLQN